MIKVLLLTVLLCLVTIMDTRPIVQGKDYEVKKKVINTPVNKHVQ
jgi:hypothetical protein